MSNNFITVGGGTPEQREIEIERFLKCESKDGRTVIIAKLVDNEGFFLEIKNNEESKRNPCQQVWFSNESFIIVISCATVFVDLIDFDMANKFKEMANDLSIGANELKQQ